MVLPSLPRRHRLRPVLGGVAAHPRHLPRDSPDGRGRRDPAFRRAPDAQFGGTAGRFLKPDHGRESIICRHASIRKPTDRRRKGGTFQELLMPALRRSLAWLACLLVGFGATPVLAQPPSPLR